MKSLPQSHEDLEQTSLTNKGDEHPGGGSFKLGCFFQKDVFYHFSVLVIYTKNHHGHFLCHFSVTFCVLGKVPWSPYDAAVLFARTGSAA